MSGLLSSVFLTVAVVVAVFVATCIVTGGDPFLNPGLLGADGMTRIGFAGG